MIAGVISYRSPCSRSGQCAARVGVHIGHRRGRHGNRTGAQAVGSRSTAIRMKTCPNRRPRAHSSRKPGKAP
jgi:hypothetical protein